jgi:hypothetical protein
MQLRVGRLLLLLVRLVGSMLQGLGFGHLQLVNAQVAAWLGFPLDHIEIKVTIEEHSSVVAIESLTRSSPVNSVRGHPSVSLPPLSSPTLPLFIYIPSPHLCTISRDYT